MTKFVFDPKTGGMVPKKDDQIYFAGSQSGGLRIDDHKNNVKYVIERDERITNIYGIKNGKVNLYEMRDARIISDRVVRMFGASHKYKDFRYFLRGYEMNENVVKGLDDFLEEGVFRNSIIRTSGTGTKRREDNMDYNPIDLGLPSGTLWCDRNVGSPSPEDYGDYFQWGGTEGVGVNDCVRATCPYRNNEKHMFEKYNDIDNKVVLDPEDDVVHVKMGGKWHMPTFEQCKELLANTNRKKSSVGGVKGMIFESKKNGNSIFIPFAGYMESSNLNNVGEDFFVWSSSVHLGPALAYKSANCLALGDYLYDERHLGFPVRGVMDNK